MRLDCSDHPNIVYCVFSSCPFFSLHLMENGRNSRDLFLLGFPGGSDGKASAWNAGDPGLTPGLGRSPGEGNGNPLQYSYLENSMD